MCKPVVSQYPEVSQEERERNLDELKNLTPATYWRILRDAQAFCFFHPWAGDPQDLAQASILAAYEKFDGRASVRAFCKGAMKFAAINNYCKFAKRQQVFTDLEASAMNAASVYGDGDTVLDNYIHRHAMEPDQGIKLNNLHDLHSDIRKRVVERLGGKQRPHQPGYKPLVETTTTLLDAFARAVEQDHGIGVDQYDNRVKKKSTTCHAKPKRYAVEPMNVAITREIQVRYGVGVDQAENIRRQVRKAAQDVLEGSR